MIKNHLRRLRGNMKLTTREVGEKIGKSYTHYSRIENGRLEPTDDTLIEILVKGFDIPFSESKNLIAKWRAEDALSKADDPQKVKQWIMGDNNTVLGDNFGNLTINR